VPVPPPPVWPARHITTTCFSAASSSLLTRMAFFVVQRGSSQLTPLLALALLGLLRCAAVSCSAAAAATTLLHRESYAGKSEFRTVNRKPLGSCVDPPSPYLAIDVGAAGPIPDEAFLQVTVSGVQRPDPSDWVAMITPSNSRYVRTQFDDRSLHFFFSRRAVRASSFSSLPARASTCIALLMRARAQRCWVSSE
jgi:hypothetical protein